ncbi:DUF6420 family protein [Streptomyces sp. NPDC003480]
MAGANGRDSRPETPTTALRPVRRAFRPGRDRPPGRRRPVHPYDGLPPLHKTETDLPRLHPYDPVSPGRYITRGGGRLTIETTTAHHQITLDHLSCDAQTTEPKKAAFKQLPLAAEGRCLQAGCKHDARFSVGNVYGSE